ncbi:MAG: AMP-binding protein, partial [Deltaproteobacteria bacterium]|nr:AMP-binding protein [Deltaproteobacteria bacterium]
MTGGSELYDAHIDEYRRAAHLSSAEMYKELYERALNDPERFWAEQAQRCLSWEKQWETVVCCDFEEGRIEWFKGGILNASYNCLDRHLERLSKKPAYYWEGDASGEAVTATYGELFEKVNKLAALLKAKGVSRGDRVVIYLPMVPELPVAMLACARIGAVHCVVYSGFGAEALAYRMQDCAARVVISAECAFLAGKPVALKAKLDAAVAMCPDVETVIVLKRTSDPVRLDGKRDLWMHEALADTALASLVPPEPMDAEDPLFILYTSGPTGKAKGIVHTHGGYLLHAAMTTQWVFDLKDDETLWVTQDLGWISGHTYTLYGPLLNGSSSL